MQNTARLYFIFITLLISLWSAGQTKSPRVIIDNNKRFLYSDSSGVTKSYISYFGDTFAVPNFTTVKGELFTLANLKGKTVIYNFWFISCRPCIAEIPALNKLAKKYQSDTILFVAVTFDDETRISEFLKKNEFDFKITSLPQAEINAIKKISFYPFTAIVTKEGQLSFVLFGRPMGKNTEEELFNVLDKQMAKALQR